MAGEYGYLKGPLATKGPLPGTPPPDLGDVFPQVIADLHERNRLGTRRYGGPLRIFNGKDGLQEAYEEALDLCVYLKQELLERSKRP